MCTTTWAQTTDLHCAPPTWIVHYAAQGRPIFFLQFFRRVHSEHTQVDKECTKGVHSIPLLKWAYYHGSVHFFYTFSWVWNQYQKVANQWPLLVDLELLIIHLPRHFLTPQEAQDVLVLLKSVDTFPSNIMSLPAFGTRYTLRCSFNQAFQARLTHSMNTGKDSWNVRILTVLFKTYCTVSKVIQVCHFICTRWMWTRFTSAFLKIRDMCAVIKEPIHYEDRTSWQIPFT